MNILYIGKRHYTNRDALQERYGRIYRLPWHWARKGVRVRLWMIDYHGRKHERLEDQGLFVRSLPIRGVRWIRAVFSVVLCRLRGNAPTHIVASGDAYIGFLAFLVARAVGAAFVFDVYDRYDVFPAYRKPLGLDLFRMLLRKADRCWFASRYLLEREGFVQRGDRVVANGLDTSCFKPRPKGEARHRLGFDEKGQYVGYFGSMDPDRGIEDLMDAVGLLCQQGSEVRLVLAGHSPDTLRLDRPGVKYLGNLPHEMVPWAIAAVDVVVIPYRRSVFLDSAASVKLAEIMACERPIVATRSPNFVKNFPEQAALLEPFLAEANDPSGLARAIVGQMDQQLLVSQPAGLDWETIATKALSDLAGVSKSQ